MASMAGSLSGEVISELTGMENPSNFSLALASLWESDQSAIVGFFISKEYQSVVKNAFQVQDEELRRLAILGYGKLFLRVWAIIHQEGSSGLEGLIKFVSLSEVRRAMDDFIDFGTDMIRQFSNAVTGDPIVSSDITQPAIHLTFNCFCAYCEVLNDLLSIAVADYSRLRRWCDTLQGDTTVFSSNPINITHWQVLISICVSTVLMNLGEIESWSNRWRGCETYFRLISSAILIVLNDVPSYHSVNNLSFDPLHSASASMFGMSSNADETLASRSHMLSVMIPRFAEQWILNSLAYFWEVEGVCSKDECLACIWDAMEISQHSLLTHVRVQVAPSIVAALVNLVRSFEGRPAHILDCSMVRYGLSLILIAARSLPTVLLPNALIPLLWCCGNGFITDHVFLTRYLAELNVLLLTRSVSCANEDNVGSLLAAVLDDSWLNKVLQETTTTTAATTNVGLGNSAANRKQIFKDRFVLTLCRGAERLLPIVINRVVRKLAAPAQCELPEGGREFGFMKLLTVENILDDNNDTPKTRSDEHAEYDPAAMLSRYMKCVNYILKRCNRCMEWPTVGLISESAALSYVSLVRAMTSLLRQAGVLQHLEQKMHEMTGKRLQVKDPAVEFNGIIESLAADPAISSLLSNANTTDSSRKSTQQQSSRLISQSSDWTSVNGRRLLLRVLIQHFISGSPELSVQLRGLDLLQASLLSGELRVCDMHQLLQLLEFAANSNVVGANNIELRRKCLTMLWTFERFVSGDENGFNGSVSGQLLALTCNLPQLRNAIQATRLRMEMSPSEPSPHTSTKVSDCAKFDTDYEEFMLRDITVELQHTLQPTISTSALTSSQQQLQQKRESQRLSSRSIGSVNIDECSSSSLIRPSFNGLADAGLEFGVFSLAALDLANQRSGSAAQKYDDSSLERGARISCAELLCLVDDVQSAFLSPWPPQYRSPTSHTQSRTDDTGSYQAELAFLQNSGGCGSSTTGNEWVRLTGSADPVVLLACYGLDDTNIMHVHTRVINSSGFRIPYFSLQMFLKYRGDGFAKTGPGPVSNDANVRLPDADGSILDVVHLTDREIVIAGDEFFLPNALVEKEFQFKLLRFCSVDVVFRIIFSDLQSEDISNMFTVPHPVIAADSVITASSLERSVSAMDVNMGLTKTTTRQSSASRSFTNSINCEPLRIHTFSQLIPYGGGVFTSMTSLLDASMRTKIPLSVMQAQCGRMSHIGSGVVAFSDVLLDEMGVDNVPSALALALAVKSTNGSSHRLGASAAWLGQVEMAESKGPNSSQLLGWCLQTVFGQEICIKVTIFPALAVSSPPTAASSFRSQKGDPVAAPVRGGRGMVEVQCSDVYTLQTVFNDIESLLDSLTGGLLRYIGKDDRITHSKGSKKGSENNNNSNVNRSANGNVIAYSSGSKDRYNKFAVAVSNVLNMK